MSKKSNKYAGQISLGQANIMIDNTRGRYFSVSFLTAKGTIREMTCRTGVRKGTTGEGLKFDPASRGLRVVSETVNATGVEDGRQATSGIQFRMIPTGPRLLSIRTGGKSYGILAPASN